MERFIKFCTDVKIVAAEVASTLIFLSLIAAGVYTEYVHVVQWLRK
jgi:hypothetical protein